MKKAKTYYNGLIGKNNVQWIDSKYFKRTLKQGLKKDCEQLLAMINLCEAWNPQTDQKLNELEKLLSNTHKDEKIIIFTQYSDTATYIYKQLEKRGIKNIEKVTGATKNSTSIVERFSPISNKADIEKENELRILIATDVLSEGQNLQDCDYLINYDIHWNPVRIIQRFGRIDRIGSQNEVIQLVNFWPNMELDEYIHLESRVSGRMVMLDMSATGEENIIEERTTMNDLEYRKKQLIQLQEQVPDIEDINGNISITDLSFNDFKMDLVNYMKNHKELLEKAPTGMYAIAKSNIDEAVKGVIFCLKQINENIKPSEYNTLNPYFFVYIKDNGEILLNFIQSKKILDIYKKVCSGENELYPDLIKEFNEETNNAKDMSKFTDFLEKTVENIVGKEEEKGIESLFSFDKTTLNKSIQNMDDFELISFLVIK
mgnify:CR=1 FL=1